MSDSQSRPYIQVPNLNVAFALALVTIIVHILLNRILWETVGLGWLSQGNKLYLLQFLFQTWMFFTFAQYLRNFKLNWLKNIFYAIVCLIIVYAAAPLVSYAFYGYSQPLVIVFAAMNNFVNLVLALLFFIAGFKLISFKHDFVGGMNLLGIALIFRAFVSIASFMLYCFNLFFTAYLPYGSSSITIVWSAIYLAGMLSYIIVFAAMAYVYKKAIDYNSDIRRKPQDF